MAKKNLISLGAGISQLPLIEKAVESGYGVVAIDRNKEAPGMALADDQINLSTYDTQAVIGSLSNLGDKKKISGLLARATGPALKTAAAITEHFHLRGPSSRLVKLATEKAALREFCLANALPVPFGQKLRTVRDLGSFSRGLDFILKPDLPLIGKKDVLFISDLARIDQQLQQICHSSYNGFAELEEYIEGIDVGCIFRLNRGQAEIITFLDELVGVEMNGKIKGIAVSVPSVVSGTEVQSRIEAIVRKFSSLFPTMDSIVSLSFRVNFEKQAFIIELHADLTGDLIADELLPKGKPGFDFFSLALSIALGENGRVEAVNEYKPTAVIYQKDSFDVIQEDNLPAVLRYCCSYCNDLENVPGHLEWYDRWGG